MRRRSQILLSIAFLLACGYAPAAELQHLSADVSNSCPDSTVASNDRNELGDADPSTTVAPVRRTEKAKTVISPRSSSGTRASAPRWHSFLPGMFR